MVEVGERVVASGQAARECGPERWARWQRLLEDGVYASRAELARGEGISRAAVTMGLRKLARGQA